MRDSLKLPPGTLFVGEFRVVRRLSGGGMGAVYVAEQVSTGVSRALKVMHPELLKDERARERFVQEARVGARIPSDHVVQVIGAGIEQDTGTPWIAMELLDGNNLKDAVDREGPMAASDALRVFRQLCHALAAAHAVGIVHRDLKPENVLLAVSRQAFEPFTVKVLDFGIAKVMAEAKATATDAVGTPLWMAPEQTESGGQITPASDLWAVGLLAFYLLVGRDYWRTASADAPNVAAILREVLFEPIVPPSERAAELGSSVVLPQGFDAWFARCVARAPEDRFTSAREAFDELERVLAAEVRPSARPLPLSIRRVPVVSAPQAPQLPPADAETLDATQLERHLSREAVPRRRSIGLPLVTLAAALAAAGMAAVLFVPGLRDSLGGQAGGSPPASTPAAQPSAKPPTLVELHTKPRDTVALPSTAVAAPAVSEPPVAAPAPAASSAAIEPGPPSQSARVPARPPPSASRVTAGSPGAAAAPPVPVAASPAAPTRPFPHGDADAALRAAASRATRCDSSPASVSVLVVWSTDGTARSISISGAPNPATESCIRSNFASQRIPAHDPPTSTTRVSFQLGGG